MDFAITVKITADLRRRVVIRAMLWAMPWAVLAAVLAAGLTVLGALGYMRPDVADWKAWVWYGLVPLAVILLLVRSLWVSGVVVRSVSKLGEHSITYRLEEDAIHCITPYGIGHYPWPTIRRLTRYRDLWLLYADGGALVFPKDRLRGGVAQFILDKVNASGGEVK